MRFLALDQWSLGDSVLHRRDSRAKVLACLVLLTAIATGFLATSALLVAAALVASRLPIGAILARACLVLPFSLAFIVAAALSGEPERALQSTARSYVSAVCVLVLVGTTTLPSLLHGLNKLGVPPFLLEVVEFVHRYLLLVGEQAKRMALAASARGARRSFAAVAGSVGVLFARSYDRAEAVHHAMLARGYIGQLHARTSAAIRAADIALIAMAGAAFAWKP